MRSFVVAAFAALAFASGALAAPQCPTGVPCGNVCIAKGAVCHLTAHQTPVCLPGKFCGTRTEPNTGRFSGTPLQNYAVPLREVPHAPAPGQQSSGMHAVGGQPMGGPNAGRHPVRTGQASASSSGQPPASPSEQTYSILLFNIKTGSEKTASGTTQPSWLSSASRMAAAKIAIYMIAGRIPGRMVRSILSRAISEPIQSFWRSYEAAKLRFHSMDRVPTA